LSPEFEIPMTPEEWDDSGSNFPIAGEETVAEFGMPQFATKSIKFPFVITEGHLAANKDEKFLSRCYLIASFKKFSLDPILAALGVPMYTNQSGKMAFDQSKVPGKKAIVVWIGELDNRPAAEGGTGKSYVHARGVKAIGAESPI
jgi:hypothetical protein